MLFSCASAFVFLQQLHQHCIAWCFLINLPGMCLVHLLNFKTPKPKKKTHHLPNDRFLIKMLLENDVFGPQKGYPPWAWSPPQIKRRTPQLVNPTQPRRFFSIVLFSCASAFVFLQQLHQHCIAWCFLINLPGMWLVHLLNFKTPKPKK